MEMRVLLIVLALAGAFGCAMAAIRVGAMSLRRRRAVLAGQIGEAPLMTGFAIWRLRNGFRPLLGLSRALMRIERIGSIAQEAAETLEVRGISTTGPALVSVAIVALIVVGAVVGVLAESVIAAAAVCLCLVAAGVVSVRNARDKRAEAARDAVPEALESMSACFGSGFTLLQTMQQIAHDVDGPLGESFGRSAHILETGGSAREALEVLRSGDTAEELAFVAVALDVQHETGGAMRQVLDAAADTVKGELTLRRSLRVQTAQAKLSARVVAVMPLLLVAAFSLISPDFLSPFFESAFGYMLLGVAIAMQVAGVVLVRRALVVDGVA